MDSSIAYFRDKIGVEKVGTGALPSFTLNRNDSLVSETALLDLLHVSLHGDVRMLEMRPTRLKLAPAWNRKG